MTDVAVVFEGYAPGLAGAEQMAWATARRLAARGHRVAVVASATSATATTMPVYDWRRLATGDQVLPWQPDVVHAFDLGRPAPHRLATELADMSGAALVLTPATSDLVWPDVREATAALCAADLVFALTPTEAGRLAAYGPEPERIVVVGQAAEEPEAGDPEALRARHGLTGSIVLHLGRRAAFKGSGELLAAIPAVWTARPDVCFVFAGPGAVDGVPIRPGTPGVVDLGLVDERTKAGLLALADVLCAPSRADVFPLVFLEAWALGTPVVTGDFEGARDVVRDGVDGLVVPVEPAELARSLLSLLQDAPQRHAMGEAGRRRVQTELNWSVLARRILDGYGVALSRRRERAG
jgi:glycosyltransferase involved in cell wall biosynthesis